MNEEIIKQIRDRLKHSLDIAQLILFGSCAVKGDVSDSDIDLVVVLNQKGLSKSYAEKIQKRSSVTKLLSDIRRRIPLDVLVYSKDEWELLSQQDTSFIREIKATGVKLI